LVTTQPLNMDHLAGESIKYLITGRQASANPPALFSNYDIARWANWFPAIGVDVGIPDTNVNGGLRNTAWKTDSQGFTWQWAQGSKLYPSTINSATDVNTSENTLTVGHEWDAAMQVKFSGSALPSPLNQTTLYNVIVISPTTIKLATSPQNAMAGTFIDLTTTGTGSFTMYTPSSNIWRRDFTKAIVLHRIESGYPRKRCFETYSEPLALGGTYYPLLADGSTGAAITSIQLRAGEGAILMKSPVILPPPPPPTTPPPTLPSAPQNLQKK